MTDETSTRRQDANGGPVGSTEAPGRPGAYPTDTPPSASLSGRDSREASRELYDWEIAELSRQLRTTRSIECGAMTTHLMCTGCDGAAMDGGGPCQHDCHGLHHRYDPDRGIVCVDCVGTSGSFGPEPRWWTCRACGLEAPVDDIDGIPGMVPAGGQVRLTLSDAHSGTSGRVTGTVGADGSIAVTAPTGPVLADVEWLPEPDRGHVSPDDLDRFTAEQMQDPAFVRAWTAAQARDVKDAYERGVAEGRRQATEGWDREWGAWWNADGGTPVHQDVFVCRSEGDARDMGGRSLGRRTVVSRLVGLWEPAEQTDPPPPGAGVCDRCREWEARPDPHPSCPRCGQPWSRTAEQASCPTCSGPTRETVGMVCQTCGTDYAPAEQDGADR